MRWRPAKSTPKSPHLSEHLYLRGSIVGLWAGVESAIDRVNHAGLVLSMGAIRTLPRNFTEKVRLLQTLPNCVPGLVSYEAAVTDLTDRVMSRIEDRHFLVHGYTVIPQTDLTTFVLRKHRYTRVSMEDENRSYSIANLREFERYSLKLSNDWAELTFSIARDKSLWA